MTKIIATSDLHGHLPKIPPCDVLIIAGDVIPRDGKHDVKTDKQKQWLKGPFSEWLESLPADLILGIAGNHDRALEKWPDLGRELPWKYLKDSGYRYKGLWFWGSPWVCNLSLFSFHLPDEQIDEKYREVPFDTDILITHGPPHGYCDYTLPQFNSEHAGFPGANDLLERVQPLFLVCGHIHEGYGWMNHPSGSKIFNVAHQTAQYEPINALLELEQFSSGLWRYPESFPAGNSAKEPMDMDEYYRLRYGY